MIDSHCHLNFNSISENIDKIIENSKKNNVTSLLSINTNPDKFDEHLNLIKKYKGVYISYGLHPCEVKNTEQLSSLEFGKYCKIPEVIGIGETGIDLFRSNNTLSEQIMSFEMHIESSIKYKLPLIIHQRNSEKEIINVLKKNHHDDLKIVFHCFNGSHNLLNFCLENNFYISISGIITFKNAYNLRNVIKKFPLDYLLIETDSPFLSPVPMRGKSNEPSFIKYTAQYLSEFYNIDFLEFEKITNNNFFKLFNKSKRDNHLQ